MIAYVEAHAPRAGKVDYTGRSDNTFTGLSSQTVAYAFPDLSGRIDERLLQVTVTALPGDRTGVLAESDSVWFIPRPTGEWVPSGVRQVRVTAGVPGHAPSTAIIVVDPAQIRQIVRLVDGLAPAQPFAINCPAETGPRQIDLRFLGAHAKRLASLDITAFRPWLGADNGECGAPLIFTVAGRRQAPLVAGAIVRKLQHLLGASLVPRTSATIASGTRRRRSGRVLRRRRDDARCRRRAIALPRTRSSARPPADEPFGDGSVGSAGRT